MLKNRLLAFQLIYVFIGALTLKATAQIETAAPQPDHLAPTNVTVIFKQPVLKVRGVSISPTASQIPSPSIYFIDGASRVHLVSEVRQSSDLGGPNPRALELFGFRTLVGNHPVNLVTGATDGSGVVPAVPNGKDRTYYITWENVEQQGASRPFDVFTTFSVGAPAGNPPALVAFRQSNREIGVTPLGIDTAALLKQLEANPGKLKINYLFGRNDPAVNFSTSATSASSINNSQTILVNLGRVLPRRPEEYSVTLEFPSAELRPLLRPGFAISADEEFQTASLKISDRSPLPTERAKTEFFFEGTFTSIVDAKNRQRSNVGLFSLHLKPQFPLLSRNVTDSEGKPWWMAFRPLLDADVDTQHIANSAAPNRVVLGADFQLGRDAGEQPNDLKWLQQVVWSNGVRYDSDRDFKLQTLYWHTEFTPRFLNFEMTKEQRLRQFRYPDGTRLPGRARRYPTVSSYRFVPSVGYQLGGTINRDNRVTGFPTETISRLFVKLSTAVEFKQLIQFSLDDTYYFLENAPRRRTRNYLEGRFEFNTGAFFNVNLGSLQSALTLKLQRGDLPPRFKPVNALSIGVRLYR